MFVNSDCIFDVCDDLEYIVFIVGDFLGVFILFDKFCDFSELIVRVIVVDCN